MGDLEEKALLRGPVNFRRLLRFLFTFPAMLVLFLIIILFISARGSVADPDIWWHLRNAEYLLKFHQLPRYDAYSFSVAGHPWINTEWLSEIPYYLAWRLWGLDGIHALMMFLIVVIFLGLLYACYKESGNFKASVAACVFATFLARVSFGPRTILFGYAYLVILLIILQRFRQKGSASLALIPALFCLWANTHGSWLLGFVVFLIIGTAGLFQGNWGRLKAERWNPSQLRKILLTALASVAAIFVNPFGARLVRYPFDLAFRQRLNISHVAEWVSVDFHDAQGKFVLVVLIMLLLGALLRQNRWSLAELGLLLFALYSGLTYIRFLFLLGIVIAPLISKLADFVPHYRPELDKPVLNVIIMLAIVTAMTYYWPHLAELQDSVNQQYPAEALTFLKAHPPEGRMLNYYLWGGYLGWNDRNLKTFIDSRVDIFEYEGVLKDYLDLLALRDPETVLDKYQIRYVLFPPGEPLTYFLEHSTWKVVFSGRQSVLLKREDETPPLKAAK